MDLEPLLQLELDKVDQIIEGIQELKNGQKKRQMRETSTTTKNGLWGQENLKETQLMRKRKLRSEENEDCI